MRFALATLALFAALASASTLFPRQDPPIDCLDTCSKAAMSTAPNCSEDDGACLCKTPAFVKSVTDCLRDTCAPDDLTDAKEAFQEDCDSDSAASTDA